MAKSGDNREAVQNKKIDENGQCNLSGRTIAHHDRRELSVKNNTVLSVRIVKSNDEQSYSLASDMYRMQLMFTVTHNKLTCTASCRICKPDRSGKLDDPRSTGGCVLAVSSFDCLTPDATNVILDMRRAIHTPSVVSHLADNKPR